jgi:hypothetical protein
LGAKWTCPFDGIALHGLSRYHLLADQLERGWMNANAMTIIHLSGMEVLNTVLLDDLDNGAANPWAVAWIWARGQSPLWEIPLTSPTTFQTPCLLWVSPRRLYR